MHNNRFYLFLVNKKCHAIFDCDRNIAKIAKNGNLEPEQQKSTHVGKWMPYLESEQKTSPRKAIKTQTTQGTNVFNDVFNIKKNVKPWVDKLVTAKLQKKVMNGFRQRL